MFVFWFFWLTSASIVTKSIVIFVRLWLICRKQKIIFKFNFHFLHTYLHENCSDQSSCVFFVKMSFCVFVIFTAQNILVRCAFSDLYIFFTAKRQNAQKNNILILRRIVIQLEQTFENEMFRMKFEESVLQNVSLNDVNTSENFPKLNTDIEKQNQKLDLIWIDHYLLNLEYPPSISTKNLTTKKDPLKNVFIDLFFCTKTFVKRFDINLWNFHARLNFFLTIKVFTLLIVSNLNWRR